MVGAHFRKSFLLKAAYLPLGHVNVAEMPSQAQRVSMGA